MIFCVPVLLLELYLAIQVSIVIGLLMLGLVSYIIAGKSDKLKAVVEHIVIAVIVIIITHYVGDWVALVFK